MLRSIISVFVLALLNQCVEADFNDFVNICNRKQANLSECVEAQANKFIPKFLKGVKDLNLPPLVEIKLPKIHNPPSATYNLLFEGTLESFDGAQYTDSFFDAENWIAYGKLRFPKLKVHGKYKLDGVVGNRLVKGNGTADITLDNIAFEIIYIFSTIKKNETEYLELTESTLISYELRLAEYNFESLFSGNKTRGTQLNNYLNRNWSLLEDDFTRHVADVVHKVSFEVLNLFLDAAPSEEILTI